MPEYDLVIRGGSLFDGTGAPPYEADIAIVSGRIAEIGTHLGRGRAEIDARGKIVTPGFVDIHTHYDGQATWAGQMSPSSWHGVTTAVMGNCGVGFAPCRATDRSRLISLMEGVEDIPGAVLAEGLRWNWESFKDYLDALEALPRDIDIAAQLPHGALRVFVMGERGAQREDATVDDIAAMRAIARDAIRAGALGFSTSRTLNHRTAEGEPTPTLTASADELTGIALGLRDASAGVLQLVSDFLDPVAETAMIERMMRESGRPLSFSLLQSDRNPQGWKALLDWVDAARAKGLPVSAQVCGRPVGLLLGLDLTLNPFSAHPAFEKYARLPRGQRLAALRTPDVKTEILASAPASDNPFVRAVLKAFDKMFPLTDPPDYEPHPARSLGAVARAQGRAPEDIAYDWMLEQEGSALILFPFLNYADGNLDAALEMMRHPAALLGLGDGGAHVGMICDGSFPTHMLTHWTRDRTQGERLPLAHVIEAQTSRNARAMGLHDRGILRPGLKADINVIDYDALKLHRPEVVHDLPAGGRRLVQRASGYTATIVSGIVTYRNGRPTGDLPGTLIRGPKASL